MFVASDGDGGADGGDAESGGAGVGVAAVLSRTDTVFGSAAASGDSRTVTEPTVGRR
jgi:hypothetical protein